MGSRARCSAPLLVASRLCGERRDLGYDALVGSAADVPQSPKLEALFGTDKPVEIGKLYGAIDAGNARLLYQPALSHTGEHISTESTGDAIRPERRIGKPAESAESPCG